MELRKFWFFMVFILEITFIFNSIHTHVTLILITYNNKLLLIITTVYGGFMPSLSLSSSTFQAVFGIWGNFRHSSICAFFLLKYPTKN